MLHVQDRLPPEVNRVLFVRNLPYKITSEEMYDIFKKYGPIRQIRKYDSMHVCTCAECRLALVSTAGTLTTTHYHQQRRHKLDTRLGVCSVRGRLRRQECSRTLVWLQCLWPLLGCAVLPAKEDAKEGSAHASTCHLVLYLTPNCLFLCRHNQFDLQREKQELEALKRKYGTEEGKDGDGDDTDA